MLRDRAEAEDVTQETFIRAYQALTRFDGRSEPYTWFYRITINLSLNRIRSRKTARTTHDTDDPRLDGLLVDKAPDSGDPGGRAERQQLYQTLAKGIDQLSDTLRTTLILVCIDGRSHEDVAGILALPRARSRGASTRLAASSRSTCTPGGSIPREMGREVRRLERSGVGSTSTSRCARGQTPRNSRESGRTAPRLWSTACGAENARGRRISFRMSSCWLKHLDNLPRTVIPPRRLGELDLFHLTPESREGKSMMSAD